MYAHATRNIELITRVLNFAHVRLSPSARACIRTSLRWNSLRVIKKERGERGEAVQLFEKHARLCTHASPTQRYFHSSLPHRDILANDFFRAVDMG